MTRLAAIAGLAMLAGIGAAGAEVPPLPVCSGSALHPDEAALGDYNPARYGGGIVVYDRFPLDGRDAIQFIVEDCASRWRMLAELPIPNMTDVEWVHIDAYRDRLRNALSSDTVYSFADLANWAVEAGGEGRTMQVAWQSCACREASR